MAEKKTKRKAFNFLRSYFDVVNELENDTDKLTFLMSIINKQFLDENPKELNLITRLCYASQKHSIESSVKGWKRASKTDMTGNPLTTPPTNPMTNPMTNPKEEEEKEEEKDEVQDVYPKAVFLKDWNELRTLHMKKPSFCNRLTFEDEKNLSSIFKDYNRSQIKEGITGLFKQEVMPNGNTVMQSNPNHFLKFFDSYFSAYHDKNRNLYGKKE